jgi:hypothetical protein
MVHVVFVFSEGDESVAGDDDQWHFFRKYNISTGCGVSNSPFPARRLFCSVVPLPVGHTIKALHSVSAHLVPGGFFWIQGYKSPPPPWTEACEANSNSLEALRNTCLLSCCGWFKFYLFSAYGSSSEDHCVTTPRYPSHSLMFAPRWSCPAVASKPFKAAWTLN